jgi:hypothetical protein
MRDDQKRALLDDGGKDSSDHKFKNFHRNLCERFGYVHDEVDWKRDQVSLIEWIAKQVDGGKGEAVATLHDDGYWTWKKGATPPHESNYAGWRMDVYAAPQAECAPRSPYGAPFTTDVEQCCGDPSTCNDPCEPPSAQAECAPHEAQPVVALLRRIRPRDNVDALQGQDLCTQRRLIDEATSILLAAPTPERAQESDPLEQFAKPERSSADDYVPRVSLNERAQESAGVQDAIEDVAKYFEDCGDPYGAKMIRKYAFNKFAANKAELTKEGE